MSCTVFRRSSARARAQRRKSQSAADIAVHRRIFRADRKFSGDLTSPAQADLDAPNPSADPPWPVSRNPCAPAERGPQTLCTSRGDPPAAGGRRLHKGRQRSAPRRTRTPAGRGRRLQPAPGKVGATSSSGPASHVADRGPDRLCDAEFLQPLVRRRLRPFAVVMAKDGHAADIIGTVTRTGGGNQSAAAMTGL